MTGRARPTTAQLTIGQCATWACLWEVAAPKVGNVNRGADFDNLTLYDFNASAVAIGPVMDRAEGQAVGCTIREAIVATRRLVSTNTNLGMVLLIAPLAAVPRDQPLAAGIHDCLQALTHEDARSVYQAIRLAEPGGLGRMDTMDVMDPAPNDLLAAMALAADRDLVARQYTNDFQQILHEVTPRLVALHDDGLPISHAIVRAHLELMGRYPDSLIGRKCGSKLAEESALRAQHVLEQVALSDQAYQQALADFDFWLRSDGHRRNPGTTADCVAAGLFAALREGYLVPQTAQ